MKVLITWLQFSLVPFLLLCVESNWKMPSEDLPQTLPYGNFFHFVLWVSEYLTSEEDEDSEFVLRPNISKGLSVFDETSRKKTYVYSLYPSTLFFSFVFSQTQAF